MYQLTAGDTARRLADGAFVPLSAPEYVEWLAAGNTPLPYEPTAQERNAPILAELADLDRRSIRPAAAVAVALAQGQEPDAQDVARLAELEAQKTDLRGQLA